MLTPINSSSLCYSFTLVTENEPLDTWDEEETILTPDGDNENDEEVRISFDFKFNPALMFM